MVYKWAEPRRSTSSGAANPLDRVAALVACSEDMRIVQWICQKAGGFLCQESGTTRSIHSISVPAMNSVVQEFADLLSVMRRHGCG